MTVLGSKCKGRLWLAVWRVVVVVGVLVIWELFGRLVGDSTWVSRPSAIFERLGLWLGNDLWVHVAVTLWEMVLGLIIGVPLGALTGLLLGRSRTWSSILSPIVIAIYNIPMIALAPLLILWFGIDLMPKVVLVTVVTYFILFFSTFTGARSVDCDLVSMLELMGATRREQFVKVVLPASVAWIASAMKLALPYALIDAIMGEILASRRGIGFLLNNAISQIDMAGVYASLAVMMVIGVAMVGLAKIIEQRALVYRPAIT